MHAIAKLVAAAGAAAVLAAPLMADAHDIHRWRDDWRYGVGPHLQGWRVGYPRPHLEGWRVGYPRPHLRGWSAGYPGPAYYGGPVYEGPPVYDEPPYPPPPVVYERPIYHRVVYRTVRVIHIARDQHPVVHRTVVHRVTRHTAISCAAPRRPRG